jgi:hypothetical protein
LGLRHVGNAILNYVYAILEGEASIAARVVGLDPGSASSTQIRATATRLPRT